MAAGAARVTRAVAATTAMAVAVVVVAAAAAAFAWQQIGRRSPRSSIAHSKTPKRQRVRFRHRQEMRTQK